MYLNYFGLNREPFKITPDPSFFFAGGNRGAVLDALRYAVARGEGMIKVVGEVGSGKTMLCRMLERELPDNCDIIYLDNPRLSADDILHAIAFELRLAVAASSSKLDVLACVQRELLAKHADNRRVVMFIEEAQAMTVDTLEEIRMLSNLETSEDKLLQIVLFGQPELDEKLARHDIRQLRERITYGFELAPLNRAEVREYIHSRLRASGFRGNNLFNRRAVGALSKFSKGLLRRINVLSDKAMLAAFSRGDRLVKPIHVKMAARDSGFAANWSWWPKLASGLGIAVAIGVVWVLQSERFDFQSEPGSAAQAVTSAHDAAAAGSETGPVAQADTFASRITAQRTARASSGENPAKLGEIVPNSTEKANKRRIPLDPEVAMSDFIAFEAVEVDTSPVIELTLPLADR